MQNEKEPAWQAHNYCIAFLDLLGQRRAMHGQGLLSPVDTVDGNQAFRSVIRDTIGAIFRLQRGADEMLRGALERDPNSPLRLSLREEQREIWDEMHKTCIQHQRWSDGLVFFASLGDRQIKCPMGGPFWIIAQAGCHCFWGLASRQPVRGGIDAAWGVELRPGELYGPAVACAYELESTIAQYPRVVVGQRMVDVLEECRGSAGTDYFSQYDRTLAEACLKLLLRDDDGNWIVHYLGESFRAMVTKENHPEMYRYARSFIDQQITQHTSAGDTKLVGRYQTVASYSDRYPASAPLVDS